MKTALRFLMACFAASLASLVLLAVTLPLYLIGGGSDPGITDPWSMAGGQLVMLPFIVIFGLPVAFPVAALAGGVMTWLEKRRGSPFSAARWMATGLIVAALVSLFYGMHDPLRARIFSALWFGLGGAAGAWAFQRVMRRG